MDSMSRLALLQALIAGPGYGLELVERVRSRTSGKVALRNGSVYPTLRDMEREGLVTSYDAAENLEERGGRPRKYYKLTARGAKVAQEQRAAFAGLLTLEPQGA
jgi:PadR family transcriptional regulator PadR